MGNFYFCSNFMCIVENVRQYEHVHTPGIWNSISHTSFDITYTTISVEFVLNLDLQKNTLTFSTTQFVWTHLILNFGDVDHRIVSIVSYHHLQFLHNWYHLFLILKSLMELLLYYVFPRNERCVANMPIHSLIYFYLIKITD